MDKIEIKDRMNFIANTLFYITVALGALYAYDRYTHPYKPLTKAEKNLFWNKQFLKSYRDCVKPAIEGVTEMKKIYIGKTYQIALLEEL